MGRSRCLVDQYVMLTCQTEISRDTHSELVQVGPEYPQEYRLLCYGFDWSVVTVHLSVVYVHVPVVVVASSLLAVSSWSVPFHSSLVAVH